MVCRTLPEAWGRGNTSPITSYDHPITAVSPLINLEMQHNGRSAQVWMKRVFLLFVVVMGGRKGFAREHQNGFYET